MEIFDTHLHLTTPFELDKFLSQIHDDLELNRNIFPELPKRIYLLAAGGNMADSLVAQQFAGQYADGFFAAGVHPEAVGTVSEVAADFRCFASDPKFVAVGEIGLDYYYEPDNIPQQRQVLEDFLALALELDKPAMLHLRDKGDNLAFQDAFVMLRDYVSGGGRFVIHCYAGDREYAEKFLELGSFFGVTGLYTFKRAENIREAIRAVPLDRLFCETDTPYLTPVPFRGRPNSPGMVLPVIRSLAQERGMAPEQMADILTLNAKNFYHIS